MGITIKLPSVANKGECVAGWGTKVFASDGSEVDGVTSININIAPDSIVTATVDVNLDAGSNLENIHALLGTSTLGQIAELHGKSFYDKKDSPIASIDFKVDTSMLEEVEKFMGIVAKYAEELPSAMKDELSDLINNG